DDLLVDTTPDFPGLLTKKLLLDLVRARKPLEMQSVSEAVRNATADNLVEMRRLLGEAARSLDDDAGLNAANMGFHHQIARCSGNIVLAQLLSALHELFREEQRMILGIGA